MSPASLNQQVGDFLHELHECYKYCTAIRANRKIGSRHEHLDRLEDSLEDSRSNISAQYETLRRTVGYRMDYGDETARQNMNSYIRKLQTEVKNKLYDVAYRSEIKVPGFKNLLMTWKTLEESVKTTLARLAQRLASPEGTVPASRPVPVPTTQIPVPTTTGSRPTETVLQPGEMVVPRALYERLQRHMDNSWSEKILADGRTMYVNVSKPEKMQLERPDGYVKRLRRSESWEEIDRRPIRRDERVRFADGW